MSPAPGLAEPLLPRLEVPTEARKVLEQRLRLWSAGSLGLAGPRGVGKTTLIKALCRQGDSYNGRTLIAIEVSAPVKYESRDFILHVFNCLCESVLEMAAVPVPPYVHFAEEGPKSRRRWRPRTVDKLMRAGAAAREGENHSSQSSLASKALEHIKEVRFQQTYTSGWGGTLNAPIAGVKLEGGRSLARNALSLPEINARFLEFVALLAASGHIVVIAIDELDKIASEKDAGQFLNDIKGIFGARSCFFLLSVSEEAMSAFERRGLPARDAIDSALDDVVTLDYMDFEQSADLLRRRVIGLPYPFVGLCHVLGGGLPRETLRVARRLAEIADHTRGCQLDSVAHKMTHEDLLLKLRAAEIASRRLEPVSGYFARGIIQGLKVGSSEEIFAACDRVSGVIASAEKDPTAHQAIQLIADGLSYAYFLSTVADFFGRHHSEDDFKSALRVSDSDECVDVLARARQAFASDPRLAWERTSTFRRAWASADLPYPLASLAPQAVADEVAIAG